MRRRWLSLRQPVNLACEGLPRALRVLLHSSCPYLTFMMSRGLLLPWLPRLGPLRQIWWLMLLWMQRLWLLGLPRRTVRRVSRHSQARMTPCNLEQPLTLRTLLLSSCSFLVYMMSRSLLLFWLLRLGPPHQSLQLLPWLLLLRVRGAGAGVGCALLLQGLVLRRTWHAGRCRACAHESKHWTLKKLP